jgi:hypothetical protein
MVYENDQPVEGATISIGTETLVSNSVGLCSIALANGTYNYTASFNDYPPIEGEVTVLDEDIDEVINFVGITFNKADLQIFPNPVKDQLNIIYEGYYNIKLVNVIGEVLINKKANTQTSVDVSDFTPGLYLLRIEKSGQVISRSIIIRK